MRPFQPIIPVLILFTCFSNLSAMGGAVQDIPMKPSNTKFEDGEYIRMATYTGGEKTEEWHIVARIDKANHLAQIYWQALNLGLNQKLPSGYTNYNTYRYTIDLNTGSEIRSVYRNPVTNDKSVIRSLFQFDTDKNEIYSEAEIFDGYETRMQKSRISVRPGYPVFDPGALYYNPRFLDITGAGIVYLCEPRFIKQPIPINFKYIKREIVKTPAGTFKTIKVSLNIADPFLSKLVAPYTRQAFIWFEDSPRQLAVKVTGPGAEYVLEEISTIKEKGLD